MPFLFSSSLGAGLGKRTQKPLGAHQERVLIAMKENTAVLIYRPNYKLFIVSCVGKFDIVRLFRSIASFHHSPCFTPIISLLFTFLYEKQEESSPKIRELISTLKTKKF
jgi:hypothetical protein